MKEKLFIVVFNDEQGMAWPMAKDKSCEGALQAAATGEKIASFTSREAARKAIDISAKYAALCEVQGAIVNTDFTEGRKFIRVVEIEIPKEGSAQ